MRCCNIYPDALRIHCRLVELEFKGNPSYVFKSTVTVMIIYFWMSFFNFFHTYTQRKEDFSCTCTVHRHCTSISRIVWIAQLLISNLISNSWASFQSATTSLVELFWAIKKHCNIFCHPYTPTLNMKLQHSGIFMLLKKSNPNNLEQKGLEFNIPAVREN